MNECGLCERQLGDDAYLCQGCRKATTVRLECLPELYEGLAHFLAPRSGRDEARRGRRVEPGLPLNERVLDLRGPGGMVAFVEGWRAAMHNDLGWDVPRVEGTIERRLERAVEALRQNMLWIASSWPVAGAFAEEIRDLANDAASIIDPRDPGERGTRLGYCPAVDESGSICGAVVRYQTGAKAAVCSWCGCSFPPAMWLDLKTLMDEDAAERNETRDGIREGRKVS